MRFAFILIFILSFVYSTTTVFVSGYDIENGYLEIKMINEEEGKIEGTKMIEKFLEGDK